VPPLINQAIEMLSLAPPFRPFSTRIDSFARSSESKRA
jgi:hypothetical protein